MSQIEYSVAAQLARAFLLAATNDIILFVEDVTGANMYVALVNRILASEGSITHVFPLGSRRAVIEAAATFKPKGIARPYLFLIDGDLELLGGKPPPADGVIFRLPVYCIENLLLEDNGIIDVAFESDGNTPRAELAERLALQSGVSTLARMLLPIFEYYALAYALGADFETVSFSVFRLLDNQSNPATLSPSRCASRIRDVRGKLVARLGWTEVKRQIKDIRSRSRSISRPLDLISAKDIVFPLLAVWLRRVCRFGDSTIGLKVRLAQRFRGEMEPRFAATLLKLLNQGEAI
jgi:Protein of unknown function (DUF4435)